ncbi:SIMPL domain-containing protein [Candidatus Kaiserbacteria bacterium]|nr:SIMPL domain-containing protein [Candidatus Kaiserbacteria bacterium]
MNPTEADFVRTNYWMRLAGTGALGLLALFLLIATIYVFQSFRYIGSGVSASNTVTVSGDGEVLAVPDTATFSVTIQETDKEVKPAQDRASKKSNDIIAYLTSQGIDKDDIQTSEYSIYPQYKYSNAVCSSGYCPPSTQTLSGYQVSMTLTVKVRDTEKAGDLLSGVGSRGASQVSGLSFTIDDEAALQLQARGKAIDKAKERAEELADQLGVRLVRVVQFSENNGPIYYAYGRGGAAMDAIETKAALPPSPEIPVGQNKITSNVTITYEIR